MPERPDLVVYAERLLALAGGSLLRELRIGHPFVLRSVAPPPAAFVGQVLQDVRLLGKRIVLRFDAGGLDPLAIDAEAFAARLRCENHTLKRALTDPALFAGIGNAYSDEILHRVRLSPLALSRSLDDAAAARLWHACRDVLQEWTERLRAEAAAAGGWPKLVTAFHPQMAVHGRYGQPCLDCGAPVQRIVYASNECNHCARCQTAGRLLADRALSRLLEASWPKTIDEV